MAPQRSSYTRFFLSFLLCLFLLPNAVVSRDLNGFSLNGALIPPLEILPGGPPRDGIPSIDHPEFVIPQESDFLKPDDRILGIVISGTPKAYPIKILNWHEIVNDTVGDFHFAVTYCPLCGTGVAFSADILGEHLVFGVSGLLYNSDVLLYDRKSESLWSQIMGQAVTGPFKGRRLEMLPLLHTTWDEWRTRYPTTAVLSTKTGFSRDYSRNPYAGYEKSTRLYFKISHTPPRTYHQKERVLGIQVGDQFKAYPFIELNRHGKKKFTDQFGGKRYTIFWNSKNQSGSIRDYTGKEIHTIQAFWFAWYTFHPETQVFKAESKN